MIKKKKKATKKKAKTEIPKTMVRDRHRTGEGPVIKMKTAYEREAAVAVMLADRKAHPDIISTLRHQFGMSFSGAKAVIHRVYTGFWDNIYSAAESIQGRFPSVLSGEAVVAGLMMRHAMSLEQDIAIAKDLARAGDGKALAALEKLERQYAELFGLLSRGPQVLVGVKADGAGSRVIVSTSDESKAKSVLATLTKMTGTQLEHYVMKHLPDQQMSPEQMRKGEEASALLKMADEMGEEAIQKEGIIDAEFKVKETG